MQNKLLSASNRPKFLYFFQGGYGLPGLNAFDANPALLLYRWLPPELVAWTVFIHLKNQRQILLDIDKQSIDVMKEDFLLNTHIVLKQQNADITKLEQMINTDNDIISKRTSVIKVLLKTQMDNGALTVHDYISQLDAEDQAKQNLIIHQVQLLMDEYNYQNTTGN